MGQAKRVPLLEHPLDEQAVFTAQDLTETVRRGRGMEAGSVPALCVLEFDGDLTDWLVANQLATPFPLWPCFHTSMVAMELEGVRIGIVPRTIGGPYAVLIAEQLAACGVKLIIGLTSAGRVWPQLPLPSLVVATEAIRDEGTSHHYLPAAELIGCPAAPDVMAALEGELRAVGRSVQKGCVWTTDAPYRETRSQLSRWASKGVLAVEMQAASLYAFGTATKVAVVILAMVSNAVDHEGEQFDTGTLEEGLEILRACARAFLFGMK